MIPVISANKRRRRSTVYNFSQADGALSGWDYTNSAWTVASNKALTTPTLGAEVIVNGTFAADTNWNKGAGWTIGSGVAAHASGTASNLTQSVAPYTAGTWYKNTWDLVTTDGDQIYAIIGGALRVVTTTGSQVDVNRANATTAGFRANTATLDATVDNVSSKAITLSDMMATKTFTKNASISVGGTLPASASNGIPFGVVGWLDSHTTPANYIIAYYATMSTASLRVDKVVGGTITNLITANPAYVAGAHVKLRGVRSGANLLITAYYNGAQAGTTQTVSDAVIVDNTRHGMFSGDAANRLSNFTYNLW